MQEPPSFCLSAARCAGIVGDVRPCAPAQAGAWYWAPVFAMDRWRLRSIDPAVSSRWHLPIGRSSGEGRDQVASAWRRLLDHDQALLRDLAPAFAGGQRYDDCSMRPPLTAPSGAGDAYPFEQRQQPARHHMCSREGGSSGLSPSLRRRKTGACPKDKPRVEGQSSLLPSGAYKRLKPIQIPMPSRNFSAKRTR